MPLRRNFFLSVAVLTTLVSGAGCTPAPGHINLDPKARIQGKAVYDQQCAQCHEANNLHLLKDPPKLDGIFSREKLPSGAPATDSQVRDTILHGRGIMPSFETSVHGDDLDALILYLHTR